MRNIFKVFLLVTIVLSSCSKNELVELPITTTSPKALDYYKKALDYYLTTDFQEGFGMLDSALSFDSDFAMASLIRWHPDPDVRTKNRKKAYSLIDKVSKAEQYILLSNKFEDAGNLDSALYYIKKLVAEYPDSYQAHNELGLIYGTRNNLSLSEKAFKKAIDLNQENYQAYTYLFGQHVTYGYYYLLPEENRDVNKGLEYAEKLIKIKPNRAHGYHCKANCYRQIGEFEKAIPLYDKSVEMSKGTISEAAEIYVSGHNLMFAGDFDKARERYRTALSVVKDIDTEQSIKTFITISHLFQRNFEGALDNLYSMKNDLVAKKELTESYFLSESREIERLKFICYAHNQMEAEAKKSLDETIRLNEKLVLMMQDESSLKDHSVYKVYLSAWNDILFGNYTAAEERLAELNELAGSYQSPTAFYGYYGLMGMLQLMEGNPQEAEQLFQKGDKRETYFNYFKALALKANGKKEKAKEILSAISSENFSYLELSLVKGLSQDQLQKL